MGFVRCLQALLLVSQLIPFHASLMTQRTVNCQNFKFVIDEDVIYNHILESHVFKRSTVHSAAQCHVECKDDCLCVSMNYFPQSKENNCELNDVNRDMEPAAIKWKQGGNYYDLVRSYTVKVRDGILSCKTRVLFVFYFFSCMFPAPDHLDFWNCVSFLFLDFLFAKLYEFKYLFAIDPQKPFL